MAENFKFELVSPERLIISEEVSEVVVPGSEGDFDVLANHAPVMSTIRPGFLEVATDRGRQEYLILGGFADVSPDGLTVLAEKAVLKADVTSEIVSEAQKAAEAVLEAAEGSGAISAAELRLAQIKELAA